MPNYKNDSKFYKTLTLDGKRVKIPPNGVFSSNVEIDLSLTTDISKTDSTPTIVSKPKQPDPIAVSTASDYKRIEEALTILHKDIQGIKKYISETVDKRQAVLKTAIETVNTAVNELEKYVYEGEWQEINMPIVVVEDEAKKGINITDLIKEQQK